MFKIKKGSTRLIIILFARWVIKIPRCYGLATNYGYQGLKRAWKKGGIQNVWNNGSIGYLLRRFSEDVLGGISANILEGWLWLHCGSSFLQPTICLIFFNLQEYAGEEIPTSQQMRPFFDSLPEKARGYIGCVDPHQHYMDNWRIVDGRLRLIDYGGKICDSCSFQYLLMCWRKEIEEGLSRPVTL